MMIITWLAYPVTMNNFGLFDSEDNNCNVKCFYEDEKCTENGNVIYSSDDKLYINDTIIAELNEFFSILDDINGIYVATTNTIFSLYDETLKPVMTFDERIHDITCVDGEFHVALKKNIMNGYKFTHIRVTQNKEISTVDTAILNLRKENLPEGDLSDPLVIKNTGNVLVKGSY